MRCKEIACLFSIYLFFLSILLFSYSKQNVGCVGCALPEEGDFIPFFFLLSFFSPSIIMWMSLWGPPFFSLLLLLLFPSGEKKSLQHIWSIQSIITYQNCFLSFLFKKKEQKIYFSDIFLSHSISSCVCVYTAVCNLSRLLSVRLTNNKEQHTGLLFPSFIDFPSYSHQRRESTVENLTFETIPCILGLPLDNASVYIFITG